MTAAQIKEMSDFWRSAAESLSKLIVTPKYPYYEIGSPYEIIIDLYSGEQVTDYTQLDPVIRRQRIAMCEWGIEYRVEVILNEGENERKHFVVEFNPYDFEDFTNEPMASRDWQSFIDFSPTNEKEYEDFIMSLQNRWEPASV